MENKLYQNRLVIKKNVSDEDKTLLNNILKNSNLTEDDIAHIVKTMRMSYQN